MAKLFGNGKAVFQQAHWTASIGMSGCLLFGITIAITHDRLYAHFSGKFVQSQIEQQWLGRIGTGLAFLFKTLLSSATSVACVQMVWWTLRNKLTTLGSVDSSFTILGNPLALSNGHVFREGPVIVGLAVISWLIPIAALIAPPTLTVRQPSELNERIVHMHVPMVNFSQGFSQFALTPGADVFNSTGFYVGPEPNILRTALAVSTQGQSFSIETPYPNSSYTSKFYGPSIECKPGDSSLSDTAIAAGEFASNNGITLQYAAWLPYEFSTGNWEPTQLETVISQGLLDNVTQSGANIDKYNLDGARMLLAVWNSTHDATLSTFECELYNASYVVDFIFKNSTGDYQVRNKTLINSVGYQEGFITDDSALMAANYISMMDAVGKIVLGVVGVNQQDTLLSSAMILNTALVTSKEFPPPPKTDYAQFPQLNKSLSTVVEDVMMNLTLSLLAQPQYQLNSSAAPQVDVTVLSNDNIYHYSQWELALSYGLAILLSTLGVGIGFWCIHENEASYSNSFSTLLRVTRDSNLGDIIYDKDTSGVDPAPSYLKKMKVRLCDISSEESDGPHYAIRVISNGSETEGDIALEDVKGDHVSEVEAENDVPLLEISPGSGDDAHNDVPI